MKGTVHKTILDLDNTGWVVKEAVFGFERSQNIPGKIFTSLSPPLLQSSEKGEFVSISGSHRLHSTRWSAVTAHRGWTASLTVSVKPSSQYCKTPPLYWRTTNEEALCFEYLLYFAGFEDHVVVSREKWLPAGRRSFFTRGRKRRTEQWRWVKTFKNAPNNVFVGFYTSAEGGRS